MIDFSAIRSYSLVGSVANYYEENKVVSSSSISKDIDETRAEIAY
jgi:hypothetical protein